MKPKSDWTFFLREVRVFAFVALFIFLLTAFGLFGKTLDLVLSLQTMESSAYLTHYDREYNANNKDDIKEAIGLMEQDKTSALKKQIFILDKTTSEVISTSSEVDSAITNELYAQSNDRFIFMGTSCCHASNFEHYKVLTKVDIFPIFQQFLDTSLSFMLRSLAWMAVAVLILALLRLRPIASRRKLSMVISGVVMFCFISTFALQALKTELDQLDSFVDSEKTTVVQDLDYVCNGVQDKKDVNSEYMKDLLGHLIENCNSIQSAELKNLDSLQETVLSGRTFDVASNLEFTLDGEYIKNQQVNYYIQAGLMFLLAFILIHELYVKPGATFKNRQEDEASSVITRDDKMLKGILSIIGIATACFSLVNVLRIREVVLLNWTENTEMIIGTIFTITMLASLIGTFLSSSILKKCGSVKAYIIVTASFGLIGASLCGVSNNPVIFVVGLIVINIATVTVKMAGDFYTTLIDDQERKDKCYTELDSAKSIGDVVGTIVGGVVSVIVSYAFVQMAVSVIFLVVISYTLALKTPPRKKSQQEGGGIKEMFISLKNVLKNKDALLYLIFVAIPGSIPFMLVEYKLPLDIAALGLTAVVLSFIKVVASVVNVYSVPLFHVVSRYLKPLDHVIIYRSLGVGVLLFYLVNGSLLAIFVSVVALRFLDAIGGYSITKTFRDLPANKDVPESDRLVALRTVCKVGDTATPTILSTVNNPFLLAGVVFVAPFVYYINDKRKKKHVA